MNLQSTGFVSYDSTTTYRNWLKVEAKVDGKHAHQNESILKWLTIDI